MADDSPFVPAPDPPTDFPDRERDARLRGLLPPANLGPFALPGMAEAAAEHASRPIRAAASVDPGLPHEQYAKQVVDALGSPFQWMMPSSALASMAKVGTMLPAVSREEQLAQKAFHAKMGANPSELGDALTELNRMRDPAYAHSLSAPVGENRSGALFDTMDRDMLDKLAGPSANPPPTGFDRLATLGRKAASPSAPLTASPYAALGDMFFGKKNDPRDYGIDYSQSPNK